MVSCRFDQTVPYPRGTVFAWHERPGALRRLTPPGTASVVQTPDNGLKDGSRSVLSLTHVPPPADKFVAEHFDYRPGESFSDRQVRGPFGAWMHRHEFTDLSGATRVRDDVTYELPAARISGALTGTVGELISRMFAYRHHQLLADLAFAEAHPGPPLTIGVSGSTGTIGSDLVALLGTMGHTVVPIIRSASPVEGAVAMDVRTGWIDGAAFAQLDGVVHLAGAPIGKRFTRRHKKAVYSSRVLSTSIVAHAVAASPRQPTLVCGSAIGYYGTHPDGVVDEQAPPGDDFLASVCRDWEAATSAAEEAGARVVHVRTGLVLTPQAGLLAKQLPLFRVGAGGPIGNGSAWWSWISIDDVVGIFAHALLDPAVRGPVNAVAPEPVRNREFAHTVGRTLSRPARLRVPELGPQLLLGGEGSRALALASQRVTSRAESLGYEFRHPTLPEALGHVMSASPL